MMCAADLDCNTVADARVLRGHIATARNDAEQRRDEPVARFSVGHAGILIGGRVVGKRHRDRSVLRFCVAHTCHDRGM
jgi:hypothetical protein